MDKTSKCEICGGHISPYDYVCDFCGTVIFENVKTTDNVEQGTLSFEGGMGIVRENLNALQDIPKPTFGNTVKSVIRIIAAIQTIGIVLIFWRRPKKRFNNDIYRKLKNITLRNISFLKISSKGSEDLISRIKVYEDELKTVDKQIKQGILSKNIALITVIGLYLLWIFHIMNQEPKSHSNYFITPYDTIASGNISQLVHIISDTVVISHTKPGINENWELDVKLKLTKLNHSNNNLTKFNVNLLLCDKNGIQVTGFEPGELINSSQNTFKEMINKPGDNISYYRFRINNKSDMLEYRDTIPTEVVKFVIKADTIPNH
jgi:hypothetical protein